MAEKGIDCIINLNKKVIAEHPGVLHSPDKFLIHVRGVYDLAEEITKKIAKSYPGIPINIGEVGCGAGLHDIGRPLSSNELGQLGHEIRSRRWIEENVVREGIVTSLRDAYRIAQMTSSHSSIYEQYFVARERLEKGDEKAKKFIEEFGQINPFLLVPRTWQEAIVTYSDLCDNNGEKADPAWRLQEAMIRYQNDPFVVEGHERAMGRLTGLCKAIDAAKEKKLTDAEMQTLFGFL